MNEPHYEDAVAEMLAIIDLANSSARTTEDIFWGETAHMPHGRVYGGQVLAQAIVAASRTLPEARHPHSMHGYFLRPGDTAKGITFSVDRIHDGRSFSTRRAQAYQDGVPIFSMISSFQDDGPGLDHQSSMPSGIPAPEDLPDALEGLPTATQNFFHRQPFELRYFPSPLYAEVAEPATASQAVWIRARRRLPDDEWIHRACLAFLSDLTIQESIMRAHDVAWATPGLKVASLDHAMWWHRYARVDEWLLYAQDSPSARGGRGLATGRIYTREGMLVASVAQEVMVRVPDPADTE